MNGIFHAFFRFPCDECDYKSQSKAYLAKHKECVKYNFFLLLAKKLVKMPYAGMNNVLMPKKWLTLSTWQGGIFYRGNEGRKKLLISSKNGCLKSFELQQLWILNRHSTCSKIRYFKLTPFPNRSQSTGTESDFNVISVIKRWRQICS